MRNRKSVDFETQLAAVEKINTEDNGGEDNTNPDNSDTDVDSDVDSDVTTDSNVSTNDDKQQGLLSGCQSSVSLAGMVTMLALGVSVFFYKKKED